MEKNRIKSIDSLRGIACLIVLIAHIISTNPNFGIYASGCGKIGVWCFMILSGFLTFLSYASGKEVNIENKFLYIIGYYKRKIVKLYPSYVFTLVFALIIGFLGDGHSIINHMLCIEGIGHFWYMPVIIKFYLIAPFLILLLGYVKKRVFIVIISLMTVIFSVVFPFTSYIENSINLYWYLPVFLIGCLLAFLYERIKGCNTRIFTVMAGVSVIIIFLLTPKMRELMWGMEPSGWLQNKYLVFAVLWSLVVLGILLNNRLGEALGNCRILQFMGEISYEVYLIHYLIMWKVVQYTNNTLWVALLVVPISILIATLLHKGINRVVKIKEK